MYVAKQISTDTYINDFQDKATPESLLAFAAKIGIPQNDVEIIQVDEATYKTIVETATSAERAIIEQEFQLTQTELKAIGQAAATKLGFTKDQMKKFVQFMREIDLDTF
jgi:thiamine biosynthesis protein ThiC